MEAHTEVKPTTGVLELFEQITLYKASLKTAILLKKRSSIDEQKSNIAVKQSELEKLQQQVTHTKTPAQKIPLNTGIGLLKKKIKEAKARVEEEELFIKSYPREIEELLALSTKSSVMAIPPNSELLYTLYQFIRLIKSFYKSKNEHETPIDDSASKQQLTGLWLNALTTIELFTFLVSDISINIEDTISDEERELINLLLNIIKKRATLTLKLNSLQEIKNQSRLWQALAEADQLSTELQALDTHLNTLIPDCTTEEDLARKLHEIFAGASEDVATLIDVYTITSAAQFYDSPPVYWSDLLRFVLSGERVAGDIPDEISQNFYFSCRLAEDNTLFLKHKSIKIAYAQKILQHVENLHREFPTASSLQDQFFYADEITRWQTILLGKNTDETCEIIKPLDGKPEKIFKDIAASESAGIDAVRQEIATIASRVADQIDHTLGNHPRSKRMLSIPALYASKLTHQTAFGAGACELLGERDNQEDSLMMCTFDEELYGLSTTQITDCLRTTLKVLDDKIIANPALNHVGATAAVTVIHGDLIIPAIIGDSVTFAVCYDQEGQPYVYRLNRRLHTPDEPEELARLLSNAQTTPVRMTDTGEIYAWNDKAQDVIDKTDVRLKSRINMSRSMGDQSSRAYGAISEPDFDITSVSALKRLATSQKGFKGQVKKIQIISTCDGFTQIAEKTSKSFGHSPDQHKTAQEQLLTHCLKTAAKSRNILDLTEAEIATICAEFAISGDKSDTCRIKAGDKVHSSDNTSTTVQTIPLDQMPETPFSCMLAVFDGHGGHQVARQLGLEIGDEFLKQCAMIPKNDRRTAISATKITTPMAPVFSSISTTPNKTMAGTVDSPIPSRATTSTDRKDIKDQGPLSTKSSNCITVKDGNPVNDVKLTLLKQKMSQKITEIDVQIGRLQRRRDPESAEHSNIQKTKAGLEEMKTVLERLNADQTITYNQYIKEIKTAVSDFKKTTPNYADARGMYSLHRYLQLFYDWIQSLFQSTTTENASAEIKSKNRFFPTTTKTLVESIEGNLENDIRAVPM